MDLHYVIIILLLLILLVVWYKEEFDPSPKLTLHYSPSCPWCKKIMPYWEQAKQKFKDKIKFIEWNEKMTPTNGVSSVPTIMLTHNGHSHRYNHQYKQGHLEAWLSQVLQIPPM